MFQKTSSINHYQMTLFGILWNKYSKQLYWIHSKFVAKNIYEFIRIFYGSNAIFHWCPKSFSGGWKMLICFSDFWMFYKKRKQKVSNIWRNTAIDLAEIESDIRHFMYSNTFMCKKTKQNCLLMLKLGSRVIDQKVWSNRFSLPISKSV